MTSEKANGRSGRAGFRQRTMIGGFMQRKGLASLPPIVGIGVLSLVLGLASPAAGLADAFQAGVSGETTDNQSAAVAGQSDSATNLSLTSHARIESRADEHESSQTAAQSSANGSLTATAATRAAAKVSNSTPQTDHFVLRGRVSAVAATTLVVDTHTVVMDPAVTGTIHETGTLRVGAIVTVTGIVKNGQLYAETIHSLPAKAAGQPASIFVAPSLGVTGKVRTATHASAKLTANAAGQPAAHPSTNQATTATVNFLSHLLSDLKMFFQQLFA